MGALGIISLITALLPLAQTVIQMMEGLFTESKSGAVKKSTATNILNSTLDTLGMVSKGGQLDTVNALKPLVPLLIEDAVSLAKAAGTLTGSKPIIQDDSQDGFPSHKADA